MKKVFNVIVLAIAVVVFTVAVPRQASGAGFGDCKQGGSGKHVFFPAAKAPKLLEALKERKFFKARVKLLEQKAEIAEEKASLWKAQLDEAEKALGKTTTALVVEKKRSEALFVRAEKWQQEAAKLKAERLYWALGGAGAAVLVVGGAVVVGWLVAK